MHRKRRYSSGIMDFAAAVALGGAGTVIAVIWGTLAFAGQSLLLMWAYMTKGWRGI